MAGQATRRILRIGVIQGGKIIEERLLRKHEPITVGTDAKNTFVFPVSSLPKSVRLFDYKAGAYTLCFDDKMDGRVSARDSALDFAALKSQGLAKRSGASYRVAISEDARGKVMIADYTLLFQFVVPPPEPAKPVLPSVARGGWVKSIDWLFAALLSTSFVVHTAFFVSFKYVDLPDDPTIFEIPDRFAKFIVPDRNPEDEKPDESKGPGEEKEKKKTLDKGKKKGGKKKALTDEQKAAAAAARRAAVREKVAGKGLLRILGARGPGAASGDAVADVFSEGGIGGDLDSAFDGLSGVGIATSATETSRRGSGGGEAAGIGDLATDGGGSANVGAKSAARVRGSVRASRAEGVDGSLDPKAITAAIKRRLAGIKRCYEQQLKRNPKLTGKIVITFVIDGNGKVSEAYVESNSMGDSTVAQCILGLIKRVRFPKPDEGTVQASFPFVFTPAG